VKVAVSVKVVERDKGKKQEDERSFSHDEGNETSIMSWWREKVWYFQAREVVKKKKEKKGKGGIFLI
jgi:hypothetical protein